MKLTDLEGVGPVRAESLRAVGICSLRDLLYTLPVRYEDHATVYLCAHKSAGNIMVHGVFQESLKLNYFHGLSRVTGTIRDESGKLSVCWFNEPWMAKNITAGQEISLYGRLNIKDGRRILQNPVIVTEPGWIPVYRPVHGFPAKSFRKLITSALENVDECCPETLPTSFRTRHRLCELNFAIRQAHFPSSLVNLEIARRRLSFERMLIYLTYVSSKGTHRRPAPAVDATEEKTKTFWKSLPFSPTGAQSRVLAEIASDMKKTTAMARMIQGDVGCGKTAVAFGAIYLACCSGFQACLMAPTEILAIQHYENAKAMLEPLGISCRLLTGSTRAKERKKILNEIATGECQAVIGTHALISKDVVYHNIGLVITDEQHRFGVRQRTGLQDKGESADGLSPHVLVMSATPIPRSLALILYGDLDLSVIDELPAGRMAVHTRMVPENKRAAMYGFLRNEIEKGRQAYVVCPLVEDSEQADDIRSAKAVFEQLKNNELKGLNIALTWGGQPADEKNDVLREFMAGTHPVLVSTTVIEVGVNNPNATIMIIENAERFGLSQLHQLRGRVGRGNAESWCFLLSDASEKLDILCSTNDGFKIAQRDLEMRGPGDLTGTRQSGDMVNSMISGDVRLLDEVSQTVRELCRDSAQKEVLETLEALSRAYFEKEGHEIALS